MFGDKIFRGDVWGKYPPIYWSRHISLAHKKWRGNLENANSRNANWQLVAGARRSAVTGGNLQPDARTWLAESGSRDHSARLWLVQRPGCHQATAGPRHHLISAIHNAHSPHSSINQPTSIPTSGWFYIHKCKVQVGILQPYPEQGLSSYDKKSEPIEPFSKYLLFCRNLNWLNYLIEVSYCMQEHVETS